MFVVVVLSACSPVLLLLFVQVVAVFFFFKQKTAYEMRISDWSSDVCSSDLTAMPSAADVLPLPGPVWTMTSPFSTVFAATFFACAAWIFFIFALCSASLRAFIRSAPARRHRPRGHRCRNGRQSHNRRRTDCRRGRKSRRSDQRGGRSEEHTYEL